MNEQYAYKTSVDVRRTFMQNGEFIGAFPRYGYVKDPENKNALTIDEEAAQVVRDIYSWHVSEGMTKRGIVKRLNELGVLNPTAYKRAKGFRYNNPHVKESSGLWNARTVTDMLADPLYIGVMRQGRQRVIGYKVHKRTAVPESDWYFVANAVPPLIDKPPRHTGTGCAGLRAEASGVCVLAFRDYRRDQSRPAGEEGI